MGICILVMLGYGHDESAPTPDGVFATNFVGVRWCFAECFATNFMVDVGNWGVFRSQFRGGRGELTECSHPISWWTWGIGECFASNFVDVKETFTKCSQCVRNLFDIHP